jgi:rhodanese-related sulfurtransferase
MIATESDLSPETTMQRVLEMFPGAQRALFQRYHIGGCQSCGFDQGETLAQLAARNGGLDVGEMIEHVRSSHERDQKLLITPMELVRLRESNPALRLLDIRTREEFEAARIEGSLLFSQDLMQEVLARWPREELFIVVDHEGKQGLDAAAYFLGHGFQEVRALRGGIDAWSQEVDENIPRYRLN